MGFAAVFPGQGSQHVGMGKFLFDEFDSVKKLFQEASDTLSQDFKKLCFEDSKNELVLTANTQPALLLCSYATFLVLKENFGFNPTIGAGHSLGEYSALTASGSLRFSDAIRSVRLRGQFMQEAVPVGAGGMAAVVGLDDAEVIKLCAYVTQTFNEKPLEPANFNAPGQVVVSGSKKAVELLSTPLETEKIFGEKKRLRVIPLNVSAPFHCSMMKAAQDKMALILQELSVHTSQFSVIQNVDAKVSSSPEQIRKNLILQISSPVKWTQSITSLTSQGVKRFVECGPGKVLAGLIKKTDSETSVFNVQSVDDMKVIEREIKA